MPHTPEVESFLASIGPFYQIAEEEEEEEEEGEEGEEEGEGEEGEGEGEGEEGEGEGETDPHSKQRSAATSGASLAGSAGSAKPGHDERRLPEGMMGQKAKTNCGAPSCVRIRTYIYGMSYLLNRTSCSK